MDTTLKTSAFFIILAMMFSISCDSDEDNVNAQNLQLDNHLNELFSEAMEDESIYGGLLSVSIPSKGYKFKKAYGAATETQTMDADDQFYSASVGKMITATLILKYLDEGRLRLDDPASKFLSAQTLGGISVINNTNYSNQITVRQLLNHTSGLEDLLGGGELNSDGLNPFFVALLSDPENFWAAEETVAFYKANFKPIASPGAVYKYSDINYLLLGLIIESVSGKKLHVVAKEKIFDVIGMNRTYYFFHENPRGSIQGREASWSYLEDLPLTFTAMSFDWAGGGLITTSDDLIKFLEIVVKGNFLNANTKLAMQNWIPGENEITQYGLGLEKLSFDNSLYLVGHGGATNTAAYYCSALDTYIVATYNQITTDTRVEELLSSILQSVESTQ